ncbi:MAG: hypothetical protein Q3962_05570 [Corynebacterium sp.]|nr:hypothetical protein [Corynebacterium sp.]
MFAFSSFVGLIAVLGFSLVVSAVIALAVMCVFNIGAEGGRSVAEEKGNKERLGHSRVKLSLIALIVFLIIIAIVRSFMG